MDRLSDWVDLVDALHPESDAQSWDSTGLQIGDPQDPVSRVLVCLDVAPATLAEAESEGCDLVLAHHPLFFRPLPRLTPSSAAGALALRAARARIGVLAAHTNLDVAVGGTSDAMVALLGLGDVRPLEATPPPAAVKLVTFVPVEAVEAVIAAIAGAGAGRIGEYDECTFRVSGTGTFRPSDAANPVVGERGRRNEVSEDRLEVVLPRTRTAAVVAALQSAHPYEEVAYDLYPLAAPPGGAKGLGRIGALPEPTAVRDLARVLADGLPAPHLRVAGDPDRRVTTVAVCGGAGDSLIETARRSGADVYVTGDLRHHPALDALTLGMSVIDAGHFATEAAALPALVERLAQAAAARGLHASLVASAVRTEPWSEWRQT